MLKFSIILYFLDTPLFFLFCCFWMNSIYCCTNKSTLCWQLNVCLNDDSLIFATPTLPCSLELQVRHDSPFAIVLNGYHLLSNRSFQYKFITRLTFSKEKKLLTIWCVDIAFGHHGIKFVNCSQEHLFSIISSFLKSKKDWRFSTGC